MRFAIKLLLMSFVFFNITYGEEIPTLTFFDLEQPSKVQSGQKIKIRGFLYKSEDGEFVLASQPNLKSCCVGTKSKVAQQIIVKGDSTLKLSSYVVLLEGVLKVDPQYNQEGELVHLYVLEI